MNKNLVALAVAGALALPLAAQAQTANVTLYGRVNTDMELMSGQQANGSNPHVLRVSGNTSRIGIRGSESLGGGLSAVFQVESGFSSDAGGGVLGSRETFVGLQGGWGTFKLGNFLSPYDDVHPVFGNTPTLLTGIFNTAAIWGQGPSGKANGAFDNRLGNSIRYDSPTMSGFTGSVQYSTAEGTPRSNSGVLSTGVFYNNGPIQLGAAFEHNEHVRGTDLDDRAWTLSGGYNFGFLRPAAVYESIKYETPTGDLKRDFWGVSLTAPMGTGTWYAFYGHASDGKGSAAAGTRVGSLAKGPDTSAAQYEISYTYPLSKRTAIYGGYVKVDNKCNANYTFNINPYAIGAPAGGCFGKPQGFVLGAYHLF